VTFAFGVTQGPDLLVGPHLHGVTRRSLIRQIVMLAVRRIPGLEIRELSVQGRHGTGTNGGGYCLG
jgi:hypothetical protein